MLELLGIALGIVMWACIIHYVIQVKIIKSTNLERIIEFIDLYFDVIILITFAVIVITLLMKFINFLNTTI
jgi:hypothetical protein